MPVPEVTRAVWPGQHRLASRLTVAVLNVRDGAGDVVRVLWPPAPTRTLKNLSGIGPRSLAHSITNYDLVRFFRQP